MMIWASGRKNLRHLSEHTRNFFLAAEELTEVQLFHSFKLYPDLNFVDKVRDVLEWFNRRKLNFLHFIPTNSSLIPLVEGIFAKLTNKHLKRAVYASMAYLETRFKYVDNHNNLRSFVCPKSADKILAKIGRTGKTFPAC